MCIRDSIRLESLGLLPVSRRAAMRLTTSTKFVEHAASRSYLVRAHIRIAVALERFRERFANGGVRMLRSATGICEPGKPRSTFMAAIQIDQLRSTVRGTIVLPGDEAYESARKVYN